MGMAVCMISGMPDPDILIMTVGRGTDSRRVDTLYESMRKSMGQGRWRRIVLLPSADTAALAHELKKYVKANHPEPLHIEVGLEIPAGQHEDEDLCFAHFDRVLERLIHAGEDPANMVFDYTRGTKAMSAAAVLTCVSRGVAKIRYVSGKRGEDGNIIPGSEEPQDGHTSTAIFRRELDRAKTLLVSGHFGQARLNLEELAGSKPEAQTPAQTEAWKRALLAIQKPHPESSRPRRELSADQVREVESGLQLARFWGAWDRFYYREAAEWARRLSDVHPFWKTAAPLPINIEAIHRLAQQVPRRPKARNSVTDYQQHARSLVGVHQRLAADLIQNAWRRWWNGEYEDALIRTFRAQELIGHLHLCRRGILASNLCLEDPVLKKWLARDTYRGAPIRLYRNELAKPMVARLLTSLGDEWFRKHASGEWDELRRRNQSPLTHGLECQATDPDSLAKLLLKVEKLFDTESEENAGLLLGSGFPVPEIGQSARGVSG
jgi:hypothetical protein